MICINCGHEPEEVLTNRKKFCSDRCSRLYHNRKALTPAKYMNCLICGERVVKHAPNAVMCPHKCAPQDGLKVECARCGEPKDYDQFRDYRMQHPDGKFRRVCLDCDRAYAKEAARRRRKK